MSGVCLFATTAIAGVEVGDVPDQCPNATTAAENDTETANNSTKNAAIRLKIALPWARVATRFCFRLLGTDAHRAKWADDVVSTPAVWHGRGR